MVGWLGYLGNKKITSKRLEDGHVDVDDLTTSYARQSKKMQVPQKLFVR